ncbi:class I SAM-dependent methyltransferase [Microbulbifer sp. OS29]|uniref:Class I SAM-dependent methyltransferase n=1 Tax=Microbulbifer okhotskensis TaxID=2926617 RepID=A0A9X2ENX9_9GAMM|nr:class I SAM-dependent methyltransferase [Microbulbifer okhotskensis]MCO1335702.1 class I SAM-dependent methyltransferase [Microbulbifer okhotskensis]
MHIELQEMLKKNPCSGYIRYHMPRYVSLFDTVCNYYNNEISILDIGRSPFTEALISRFRAVDSLGFDSEKSSNRGDHYNFDLNNCRDTELWRKDLPKYDVVVFSEVIEHLYISPNQVLAFLNAILKKGGVLLLQTPNAVALHKRVRMVFGKNPYELIRENHKNPGHYREYTYSELASYLKNSGFKIEHFIYENYFDYQYSDHSDSSRLIKDVKRKAFNYIFSVLPSSLKPGMFFCARKM